LLNASRKLDKIFGEAQPRFSIDRISGLDGLLVTLVRLLPELGRVDLNRNATKVSSVAKRCHIFPVSLRRRLQLTTKPCVRCEVLHRVV
jgi:hypothetical protein